MPETSVPNKSALFPGEEAVPIPPRYWWLRRILVATGVLIVALAAMRWY